MPLNSFLISLGGVEIRIRVALNNASHVWAEFFIKWDFTMNNVRIISCVRHLNG